ncbi:MAG: histidine-type phosphatase [Novosphingobium sp.]|uniref:histidine-type phosphatase n=1 Tax=Novosphingobium sp. TaxID=1874826 RepID=UPI0012C53C61|nr:histidine-type phosphatase [Novosphingobium sp.]MPS68053.1 histidine-type phosphatase [Novosphingobium sp.]
MATWRNLLALTVLAVGTVPLIAVFPGQSVAARELVPDKAVMVMRHGIRAPLDGEVPAGTRTAAPWPAWSVAESVVTPHGERALEIVARADRQLLARRGLLDRAGCPKPGKVAITANTSPRAIASGEAYAHGVAQGCGLEVAHRAAGEVDPIFEPLRARATAFDASAAVADIERATGGMAALVKRDRAELALLDTVLGCGGDCLPPGAPAVAPGGDGHDIALSGQIRSASGIAQVLLLQYLEGMPADQVGWGRIDEKGLERLGRLHADLFTVFTRPPYMASHQASALGRRILDNLERGPDFEVLMGHDTNVTALAAALDVDLSASGYATNDVPPGGAILIERLHDRRTGERFVRVSYRTQPPAALRALRGDVSLTPLVLPACGTELCPYAAFVSALGGRLAPGAS